MAAPPSFHVFMLDDLFPAPSDGLTMSSTLWRNLPSDLVEPILVRLPTSSQARFQAVCKWQFMSWVTPSRQISVWMRNGKQDTFVYVISSTTVTLGAWTDIAFNWDRSARTAAIYINRQKVGSQTVASNVADINLFKSSTYYYQFGSKADSANQDAKDYSPLDADLKDLRVFKGFILAGDSQPELVMSA